MKIFKKFIATTLAVLLIAPQVAFAQERSALDVLVSASELSYLPNDGDLMHSIMNGEISALLNVNGELVATLTANLHMAYEFNLEEDTFTMYIRLPIEIQGTDPLLGEELNESLTVAMFSSQNAFAIYESGSGWLVEEIEEATNIAMDMDVQSAISFGLQLNEYLFSAMQPTFSEEQVEGYYVIDIVMYNEDILTLVQSIFSYDFLSEILSLMGDTPELMDEDVVLLQQLLEDLIYAVEMLLELAQVTISYTAFINQETGMFSSFRYEIDVVADIQAGMLLGDINIDALLILDFEVDYETQPTWPTIESLQ